MHELSALDTTVSICIGESLMLVFSKPLEGVGEGDLLRHSDDSEKHGDSARGESKDYSKWKLYNNKYF